MIKEIPLDEISENPWQTRIHDPDPEYIASLAADIEANGLLQTPVGRENSENGFVELAFGHNRLRAFVHNQAETMPVDVRELNDEQMADFAWSENEQRRDLTPLERAYAVQKRIDDFEWTQEQAAQHLRLNRSSVTHILRLLKLPADLQTAAAEKGLSERQCLALVSLFDLPESLRRDAQNHYSHSPKSIIERALEGASSDQIRSAVSSLVNIYAKSFEYAPFGIDDEVDGDGIHSPACRDCEHRYKERNVCLDALCFNAKSKLYKWQYLVQASAACGVPELEQDIDQNYITTWSIYGNDDSHVEHIKQAGCENLRLVYSGHETNNKILAPDGFPLARFGCKKRSGYCTCVQGLQRARELERQANRVAQEESTVTLLPSEPSDFDLIEDDIDDDSDTDDGTIIQTDNDTSAGSNGDGLLSAEELAELARQKRREKTDARKMAGVLKEQYAQLIADYLVTTEDSGLRLAAWRLALAGCHYKLNLTNTEGKDLRELFGMLAEIAAEHAMPYDPDNPEMIVRVLNDRLERAGLPAEIEIKNQELGDK